jgi:hypothetical protein
MGVLSGQPIFGQSIHTLSFPALAQHTFLVLSFFLAVKMTLCVPTEFVPDVPVVSVKDSLDSQSWNRV